MMVGRHEFLGPNLGYEHKLDPDSEYLSFLIYDLTSEKQIGGGGCKYEPLYVFRIFLRPVRILKFGQTPVPRGSNSGCFCAYRVHEALSSTWSDLENQDHPQWTNIRFSAGRCNLSFQKHTDIIPPTTPTFSTTPNFELTLRTVLDVTRC